MCNADEHRIIVRSKEELLQIIDSRIRSFGPECSLNDLDVSNITDMSRLFLNSDFNGDISKWDVFNVEDMSYMFKGSKFSKDISSWNIIRAWKTIETAFKDTPFEDNPFLLFDFFKMDRWHEDILKKGGKIKVRTNSELRLLVRQLIREYGNSANLNVLDVSLLSDFPMLCRI